MPRSPTVLTPPPGTLPFTPNTTIESGKANAVWLDLYQDGNTPRPIVYGGTGASNAADALNNLGGVGQANFLNAYSIGDSYFSLRDISGEGGTWLRRNGALYLIATYPELAALLTPLPDGIEWDSNPTGATNTFNRVIYGGGKFVAVGDGGTIYVSTDRVNWSPRSSGTTQNLNGIAYGSGIFVAVGPGNTRVVSSDGDTWSVGTIASGFVGYSIIYANSLFIAAGVNGANETVIYRSTDGAAWTASTVGTEGGGVFDLSYNGTRFVGGTQGANPRLVTSTDGLTWTNTATGVAGTLFSGVANDGTTFVVVAQDGRIYTTTNGTSLTLRATTGIQLNGVTHSPTAGWLVVGNGGSARISSNATTWNSVTTGTALNLRGTTYDPTNDSYYVVVGGSGISLEGLKTSALQFRVPNGPGEDGWIKAEND